MCGTYQYKCNVNSSVCVYAYRCSNQCEADSLACVNNGGSWEDTGAETCNGKSCITKCDSTYHCESVFTENNVVRAHVTLVDCRGNVLSDRMVLGSCNENGFCAGSQVSGSDSCSYPKPDPNKCRNGGQNGSLCTYICPDGNLYGCTIAWEPGTPMEYQPCPSKPPSNCHPFGSSSSDASLSSSSIPEFSSSSEAPPDTLPPGSNIDYTKLLREIRDTLHHANVQRDAEKYSIDAIKNDVGGFGAQFNNIVLNTRSTYNALGISNGLLDSLVTLDTRISERIDGIDLDNLTATVDSVVVHVDVENPDSVNFSPYRDLDSLPVWRDTLDEIHRTINDINLQIDTLVQDSLGENVLAKYLPGIKRIYDKMTDFYGGMTLPGFLDSLQARLGLDTVSTAYGEDYADGLVRLTDSTYVEGNFYCEEHPDSELCVEISDETRDSLVRPDTVDINEFFREQDSIMAHIDSVLKDTVRDSVGLDELSGDSAAIREKLDFLFLPANTVESCFEFHLETSFGRWSYNLLIDFADLFGWDLCDFIRQVVRILTFILIVFTTIKGYIRAFGGGGPGGG